MDDIKDILNLNAKFHLAKIKIEKGRLPGSSDPFYIVTYYIKWVTTSWTFTVKKHYNYYFLKNRG